MNIQKYIEEQLTNLRQVPAISQPQSKEELKQEILRLLLSKKFRKYAAAEDLIEHCKQSIEAKMDANEPINITFFHGAYKLWRLDEAPHVDWAELFSLMYYTNWIKGICAVYEPGVHFDFFVDDWIIPKLNNVPNKDVDDYLESYTSILNFLKPYQPKNLNMTFTTVGSQLESREVFNSLLEENFQKLNNEGLLELTEDQLAMVELNTKATSEQKNDPDWQRKVYQLHNAYSPIKKSTGYSGAPHKILAFTQPLPSGMTISIGTTKSSVVKFWVGVSVLKPKKDSYQETILSYKQLKASKTKEEKINIKGLDAKNFEKIRILLNG